MALEAGGEWGLRWGRMQRERGKKNTFDTLSEIYSMHVNALYSPPAPQNNNKKKPQCIICSTFSTSVVLSDCNLGDIGTKPLNVAPVDPL